MNNPTIFYPVLIFLSEIYKNYLNKFYRNLIGSSPRFQLPVTELNSFIKVN